MKYRNIILFAAVSLLFLITLASRLNADDVVVENSTGIRCIISDQKEGYAFGSIYVNRQIVEKPLLKGMMSFKNSEDNSEYWLYASEYKKISSSKAEFFGTGNINGVTVEFNVTFETPPDVKAVRINYGFSVDSDISNLRACLQYNTDFDYSWRCHMYPWAEDAKYIQRDPLTWVGIPSLFLYRDDRSMGILWGIEPSSDYLNPTTWTKDFGLYFIDGVMPAHFRVGGTSLKGGFKYSCPMQIIFTDVRDTDGMITELVKNWMDLNDFEIESLFVRTNDEALNLFIEGRKNTNMWYPGKGYRLEMGDPSSAFIYIGEQGLSAYFDYLVFELTGDSIWRKRTFEQMDFILKGQNTNPFDPNYGVVHTAYSLVEYGPAGVGFNSVDRGANKGYKPDLNAYLARYMLQTWLRVKEHEGIDRHDWYKAAILAIDWVRRQQNNDKGLPQKVQIEPIEDRMDQNWMRTRQPENIKFKSGEKSRSTTSGKALPAFWHIYKITGDPKYKRFMEELEEYTLNYVQNKYYYTSHHPDLPPYEFEEASIWGVCEYWLNRYDETDDEKYLDHAVADAYLALAWWCPKQLSWVKNPTQFASAEQQHFLQYSVYCYQNRKIECLKRLYDKTRNTFFNELTERVLQNIYWTQITEGNLMGATHERICDPWLARSRTDFNSLGTVYMSEQSLDSFLQILEMYRTGSSIYSGKNLANKVYPDGICYYSEDISKQEIVYLSVLPSGETVNVVVNEWTSNYKRWTESSSTDGKVTTIHTAGNLEPKSMYNVYVNGEIYKTVQSNDKGIIRFSYSGSLSSQNIFEVKEVKY